MTNKATTKRSIIVSALLVIALCASITAGATYAIFTSESQTNIAVISGNIDVKATLSDLWVYSPTLISTTDYTYTDATNAATVITEGVKGQFKNGGTATLDNTEGIVTLDKMTPGDKATFTVTVTNKSNVDVQYRTVIKKIDTTDETLFAALDIDIGGVSPEYYFGWQFLKAASSTTGDTIKTYDCSVELPASIGGSDYMDKKCTIAIIVEVVQGNADTSTTISKAANSEQDVIITDNEEDESAATVKAFIPAGSTSTDTTTLTLIKMPTDVPGNITIQTGNTAVSTDVKIIDQDGNKVTAAGGKYFTITLQLDKNLTILKFYHKSVELTKAESVAAFTEAGYYYYDVTTGKLTYTTQDFSVFTAVIKYAGGLGTQDAPYLIADAAQLKAAMETEDGAFLKLANDITWLNTVTEEESKASYLVEQITITGKKITLDLNGKTISVDSSNADTYGKATPVLFTVTGENALFTVNDSSDGQTGTIDCEAGTSQVYGISIEENAKLIINGGNFYGAGTVAQVTTPGSIEINGGFFDLARTVKSLLPNFAQYIINCKDEYYTQGTIVMKGGTIVGFDPSNNPEGEGTSGEGTSYVADGYTVKAETQSDDKTWYTVVKKDETAS